MEIATALVMAVNSSENYMEFNVVEFPQYVQVIDWRQRSFDSTPAGFPTTCAARRRCALPVAGVVVSCEQLPDYVPSCPSEVAPLPPILFELHYWIPPIINTDTKTFQ